MLTAMSSIAGTEALRHTISGSWFIESLCKLTAEWCTRLVYLIIFFFCLQEFHFLVKFNLIFVFTFRKHMVDILTNVTADVAQRSDKNEYMLPIMSSTLRKDFFLPPQCTT